MRAVEPSPEFWRVHALPRRDGLPPGAEQLEAVFRPLESPKMLRPVQLRALAELVCCRGLLGPIRVGAGKTLISYLAPRAVGAQRPLLLIPAKLRDKTRRDFDELRDHWSTTIEPIVMSYELLGRVQSADYLEEFQPDLIIADEAHRLKNVRASVTRRVGRWMAKHPETMFVALSGTLTKRSLMDFAHLAEWCLGERSPLPLRRYDLEQWAMALDEISEWCDERLHPGPLLRWADPTDQGSELERARAGFRRRLAGSPGVVVEQGAGITAPIVIDQWKVEPPREITEALRQLEMRWETPDGQLLVSAADVWRHARELALGFWYRWDPTPPRAWLEARREWAAFARDILQRSRSLDSEAQVAKAYQDVPVYRAWSRIRDSFQPRTSPVWMTSVIMDRAAEWYEEHHGLVWVEHRAVGKELEVRGLDYYGRMGRNSQGQPVDESIRGGALSIAANSEGRNLQQYADNLVLSPPTTGDRWEQLLGRTHRDGQLADEVSVQVYLGCGQDVTGFWQSVSDAWYQHGVHGAPQKLLLADITFGQEGA